MPDGAIQGYRQVRVGNRTFRVMDPAQRPTLKLILSLFNDGYCWNAIRHHMNNVAHIPTANGTKWRYDELIRAANAELAFQYIEVNDGDWGREPQAKRNYSCSNKAHMEKGARDYADYEYD